MFPNELPAYDPFTTPITLQALQHTDRHRQMENDIVAIATKVGLDGSADPTSFDYMIAQLASDMVTAQGDILAVDGRVDDVIDGSEALSTPQILNFGSAQHDHEDTAGGGVLTGAALPSTDGILRAVHYYTYDGTDVFIDGVDQNNGDNTVDWTKPAGLKFVVVEVIGGGGAGGGRAATAGGQYTAGNGGSGGVYSRSKVPAASLGSTEVVTVGAGATAGTGNGPNGGNSSFGAHCVANGGIGGTRLAATSNSTGRFGTGTTSVITSSVGDVIVPGGPGLGFQAWPPSVNTNVAKGGSGGDSFYGAGGRDTVANSTGIAGIGYGGGGSGAVGSESLAAGNGGNGSHGLVVIWEYY